MHTKAKLNNYYTKKIFFRANIHTHKDIPCLPGYFINDVSKVPL